MLALLLTMAALSVGPLIHRLVLRRSAALELLDAFTVLHVGGWPAGVAVLLGIASPVLAEELLHRAAEKVHGLFLAVAMLGIGLHAFFDGIALAAPGTGTSLLAIGVIIHSVPVGLTVSWLLLPGYGLRAVVGTIGFMIVATVGGFVAAPHLPGHEGGVWLAVLQAFVAGSLVHVLAHGPHLHGPPLSGRVRLAAVAAGMLFAAGVLAFLLVSHAHERPPPWLMLCGAPVLLLFLFLHYAPRRWKWSARLAPWRQHEHDDHDHDHEES